VSDDPVGTVQSDILSAFEAALRGRRWGEAERLLRALEALDPDPAPAAADPPELSSKGADANGCAPRPLAAAYAAISRTARRARGAR